MIINGVLLSLLVILAVLPSGIVLLIAFLWCEALKNALHRAELTVDKLRNELLDIGTQIVTIRDGISKAVTRCDIVEGKVLSVDESIANLSNKLAARHKAEEVAARRRRKKDEEEEEETTTDGEQWTPPPQIDMFEQSNETPPQDKNGTTSRIRRVARLRPV